MKTPKRTPDSLKEALATIGSVGCSALILDDKATIIIKASSDDIKLWHGQRPIKLQPMLGKFQAGAVLALVTTIYELSGSRFTAETLLNVNFPSDLVFLNKLSRQNNWYIAFFNDQNEYQFGKAMPYRAASRAALADLIEMAITHNQTIEQADWSAARLEFFATSGEI